MTPAGVKLTLIVKLYVPYLRPGLAIRTRHAIAILRKPTVAKELPAEATSKVKKVPTDEAKIMDEDEVLGIPAGPVTGPAEENRQWNTNGPAEPHNDGSTTPTGVDDPPNVRALAVPIELCSGPGVLPGGVNQPSNLHGSDADSEYAIY